ncbi:MAG: DUF4421 family protein [Bacteroidales bacterium]|nr:DUF4421 family protein [Bacteroidales bacterium]
MKRFSAIFWATLFFIIFPALNLNAQETWLGKNLNAVGRFLDERAMVGVDSAFLSPPKHGWMVSVSSAFAGINTSVAGHNIPTYNDIDINMKSGLNGKTSIAFGYRSLSVKYSINVSKGYYKDLNISLLTNGIGVELRSHTTEGLSGTLDASATPEVMHVKEGDTKLRATIINGYYVLNSRRYSLPAAMGNGAIQKRSSGSLTAYAVFLNAKLEAQNNALLQMLGGMKTIDFYQAAAGIGYGYNFTPNQGKLLFHASAAPLVVFFNKNFITASTRIPLPDGTVYATDISKEVKSKNKVFITAVGRASVIYTINDHFQLGLNALLNDIRFNAESGVRIGMDDWVTLAYLSFRF